MTTRMTPFADLHSTSTHRVDAHGRTVAAGAVWTADRIAGLPDEQVIEQLLVELGLRTDDDAPLAAEVVRRGLVAQATARVAEAVRARLQRLG